MLCKIWSNLQQPQEYCCPILPLLFTLVKRTRLSVQFSASPARRPNIALTPESRTSSVKPGSSLRKFGCKECVMCFILMWETF